MSYFGRLPAEIVCLIGEYLDDEDVRECLVINKLVYTILIPPYWRRKTLFGRTLVPKFVKVISQSPNAIGHHIWVLNTWYPWTNTLLLTLLLHLPRLTDLTILLGDGLTDACFRCVGRYCPLLTTLQLIGSPITNQAMGHLGRHCRQLKRLELGNCTHLTCDLFTSLTWCALEEVEIYGCELMENGNDDGNSYSQSAAALVTGLLSQRSLKRIRITEKYPFPLQLTLSSSCLAFDPTTAWPNLVSFSMDDYLTLNESQAIAFIQSHPHLESISLKGGHLTDTLLDTLASTTTRITSLALRENPLLTLSGMFRLIHACPLLSSLFIGGCGFRIKDFPNDVHPGFFIDDQGGDMLVDCVPGNAMDMIRQRVQTYC